MSPMTFLPLVASTPLFVINVVSTRSCMLGATDLLEVAALDKYSFVRDGPTDWGKAVYRRRKETAERRFADAK